MQTLASYAVIPSAGEESLFGLFRATKSSHAKEFLPLLANFIGETSGTAARQLRGNHLAPTAFALLLGPPALPTLLRTCPKSKNHPKIAGRLKVTLTE
jgi:hypothetical protein